MRVATGNQRELRRGIAEAKKWNFQKIQSCLARAEPQIITTPILAHANWIRRRMQF